MHRILRTREVLQITSLSRTTLWRCIRGGDFPPPLRLGSSTSRCVGWRQSDVEDWLSQRPLA